MVDKEKKAVEARNEYILALIGNNAFKQQYYQRELANIVDAMDNNYHDSMRALFEIYNSLMSTADAASASALQIILKSAHCLDPLKDKNKFLADHGPFLDRQLFPFLFYGEDKISSIQITPDRFSEMQEMWRNIELKIYEVDLCTEKEQTTIDTMLSVKGKAAAMFGMSHNKGANPGDGVLKSAEGAALYAESNLRVSINVCLRARLVSSERGALVSSEEGWHQRLCIFCL